MNTDEIRTHIKHYANTIRRLYRQEQTLTKINDLLPAYLKLGDVNVSDSSWMRAKPTNMEYAHLSVQVWCQQITVTSSRHTTFDGVHGFIYNTATKEMQLLQYRGGYGTPIFPGEHTMEQVIDRIIALAQT